MNVSVLPKEAAAGYSPTAWSFLRSPTVPNMLFTRGQQHVEPVQSTIYEQDIRPRSRGPERDCSNQGVGLFPPNITSHGVWVGHALVLWCVGQDEPALGWALDPLEPLVLYRDTTLRIQYRDRNCMLAHMRRAMPARDPPYGDYARRPHTR